VIEAMLVGGTSLDVEDEKSLDGFSNENSSKALIEL
jgi:hypothetical protein